MSVLVAVFGPTAVGKTEFAIALGREIGGEIVNADAVQLYRGLDRGSAKPPLAERGGVAHHLLDVADPEMAVSVAVYQTLAQNAIREILRRGAVPIVTGGSGLYLRAALGEWHAFGAPPDPALRAWAAQVDVREVYELAVAHDPAAAARLSPSDRPRLVRVIERARTGVPHDAAQPVGPVVKIGLQLPRVDLYTRIDARSVVLWPHLVRETTVLLDRGPAAQALAERTIGYREAALHLRGSLGEADAIALLQRNTRRLAKRQMTWWRREANTIWLRPDVGIAQLRPSLKTLLTP